MGLGTYLNFLFVNHLNPLIKLAVLHPKVGWKRSLIVIRSSVVALVLSVPIFLLINFGVKNEEMIVLFAVVIMAVPREVVIPTSAEVGGSGAEVFQLSRL